MAMVQTTEVANRCILEKVTYMCSTTDFVQTTDKPDGTPLEVVDESTHKVVKYCVAFNGYWNER